MTHLGEPGDRKDTTHGRVSGAGWTTRPESSSGARADHLPYGEGITYWALGEMVKAQAGILESDGPAGSLYEAPRVAVDEIRR